MTLEIRGVSRGLLDDPLRLEVRGAVPEEQLLWRARYRDDDMRVWRAAAARAEDLTASWRPAKPSTGPVAALRSLRPVQIDVRVEAPDGRAAARALTRAVVGEGVRVRRWREAGLAAALYLPSGGAPCATLLVDGPAHPTAAPLLASRGVLVLVLTSGALDEAQARLATVPGASSEVQTLSAAELVLPPNVGVREEDGETAALARAAAWDELLSRLRARPRGDTG